MNRNPLSILGLAQKAGLIITGEDSIILGLQKNKIKLVLVASDASLKTIDKFKRKCYFYKVPCWCDYTADELSSSIGKWRKLVALTDEGMVKTLEKYKR
ncbi:MAG: 50S ribosomal protein L7ae [Bacilli bacterium]